MSSDDGFRQLTRFERNDCFTKLRTAAMFRDVGEEDLRPLIMDMRAKEWRKGDVIMRQEEPTEFACVIAKGTLQRTRVEEDHYHVIEEKGREVFSSLHLMQQEPSFSTVTCVTDKCLVYTLPAEVLNRHLDENRKFSKGVIQGLSKEVRKSLSHQKTPLFEQKQRETKHPLIVNSIAAGIESFYRSGMNTALNYKLAGKQIPSFLSLFPNMHQQIPIRIFYINGFKGIRLLLEEYVDPKAFRFPQPVQMGMAVLPGFLMTPVSSLLEAANVKENTEPLWKKWRRGLVPRTVREVLFGVGLNQLSDYFEERFPFIGNAQLRNAAGSLAAGICCGYITHILHNLSALKLMNPQATYSTHFKNLQQKWIYKLETKSGLYQLIPPTKHVQFSQVLTCIAPIGVFVRTSQIVGSFIVLNGIINFLKNSDLTINFNYRPAKS